ncbi:acyl-CoA dehydrogenase family protein [Chromobacterium alkanivorans]|uniref:acyl-CoA dehydrogenase family protein n=1 Tax=Chromobacterium alkanivorans TaxID=1071719 RepID=UPI001967EC9F|nr:acyl-CoA dehydrogenase family protein [Chromobacterium alkanivorans]MBN3003439.1 acyl-CoA dehydrogenase family protein [Chromobacterium alkanivorans]
MSTDSRAIPDRHGGNLFLCDPSLASLLRLYLPQELYRHLEPRLIALGAEAGGRLDELALAADKHPPTLQARSRAGEDSQRIDKHPAYVELEKLAFSEYGLAAMGHRAGVLDWPERLPRLAKYAFTYLLVQAEFGLCCPLSMTDSLTSTLLEHGDAALAEQYLPALLTQDFARLSQGAMFITEQGAGSDVSRVETRAYRQDGGWRLEGEKWFCSNPDAGLAMVLAHVDGAPPGFKGLGLFLLPRRLPDGRLNHYRIVRLKDKLGSRSMASGEIRLEGALAHLVGEVGRGFQQMATMINLSRLSNGVRAAGLMRRALTEALHTARHRRAFGRALIEMPLMQRSLIKMLLPAEQARSMFLHLAACADRAQAGDAEAAQLSRILTPLIKFRACRDARQVTQDGMEVRGGCGYIEEWSDPRVVRDAMLGSIWEGTSNIVALDVARAARRNGALPVLQHYLARLLSESELPAASQAALEQALGRVSGFAAASFAADDDVDVRRAASALYHIASAVFMAWESARAADGDHRRLALAHLALRYRLQPRDPLAARDGDAQLELTRRLLDDAPISQGEALAALPL